MRLLLLLLLAACNPDPCGDTAAVSCSSEPGCTVVRGTPAQADGEGGFCLDVGDATVAYSCQSSDIGCDEALTWAAPADSPFDCVRFPNSCIPEGWGDCADAPLPECRDGV